MVLIDGKTQVKRSTGSSAPDANGARVADGQAPAGPSTTALLSMQAGGMAGGMGGAMGSMGAMGGMPGMGAMGGVPGMGGMPGMGMSPMAAAGGASGGFDFFAHMAAQTRMQAAMLRAMDDGEESSSDEDEGPEKKKAKVEDEGPAFDKDALARLAQRAEQGGVQSSSASGHGAAEASVGEVLDGRPPAQFDGAEAQVSVDHQADVTVPPPPPGGDEAVEAEAEPEEPENKKDDLALSSLLQQVQSNVELGKEAKRSEKVVQGFSIGSAGRADAGGAASGASAPVGRVPAVPVSLLESLLRRVEEGPVSSETRRALEQEALDTLPSLEPLKAADLLARVFNVESMRTVEFLEGVIKVLLPVAAKFSSPHLTKVLGTTSAWAVSSYGNGEEDVKMSRLSERCKDFFGIVATELALRLMDVVPRDLVQIAMALSGVGYVDARLYGSLARAAVARSERFTPQEIVCLGVAFDKAGYMHTSLCETLAKAIRSGRQELTQRELMKGFVALARAGIRDEELGQVIGDLVAKKEVILLAEEQCTLAWGFVTLGMYHDAMFRTVLHTMEAAPVVPSETLCQLYEIHTMLVAYRHDLYKPYELPSDTVKGLRDHYKKNRGGKLRELRLEKESEKLHKDVKSVLTRVIKGDVHEQFQTHSGFIADMGCTKKRSTSKVIVLVEVDGPTSLLESLDPHPAGATKVNPVFRVRGDSLLKRRVLQQNGFHVAVFGEELWKSLDEGKDKREFLRELLRIAGIRSTSLN